MLDKVDSYQFKEHGANADLSSEDKVELLRKMVRIRRFEEASLKYYNAGKMGGFLHLYIGQESIAVGTASLCGKHDHLITAYRDHGHALAVGMTMNECMAELFGKKTGCSKGKGGSMHFFAPDKNYWGGHGIVAGQTPLGLGLAYGLKYNGDKGAALCFMGDGAVNQGSYHESLNLAQLFELPVIYIIENNGYSMGTSQERSSAFNNCLAQRAEAYGIAWDVAKGNDIYEVRAKTKEALDRAHNDSKPTILEFDTYRYQGHSVADANSKKYRSPEEIDHYKENYDPISVWKKCLLSEKIIDDEIYKKMDTEAKKEAKDSVTFAEESPFPDVSAITEDVYYEVDEGTESGKRGKHFFHN